ncbi:host specificity protein [Paracoccus sp. M683]|uniref:baseplate multidomain protein megatron n=1 Tax=Paracoccus sp. M683 TaxID=2594268 RepID=UPI001181619F|nr:glycoside hydrolase/phage tail family protein [Paracoccus sp. M683]TRW96877.1 host specificity protein [Paracoccus sp. M683]
MATLVLSAVGASVGAGFGGAFLGLSGAVIGRAIGATIGRAIDQRLLGGGSKAVETGRIDRLRLQTAGEGMPIPRLWGQMRLPGHVIWASPLEEIRQSQGAGKGAPKPQVTEISYQLSVALALSEGRVLGVGRIWADGEEIAAEDLNMRVYRGSETQLPDPAIAAHEGEDAPAYRGIAYVVLENLSLARWGNRMPQLSFEVTCAAQDGSGLAGDVQAVAMIPGTGEYSLATSQVMREYGMFQQRVSNVNTPAGGTDFAVSLRSLRRELPNVGSVSLVVSWFGDDLRIGHCSVQPKVEHAGEGGYDMEWRAGGIGRAAAAEITRVDERPIYGGTPCDQSVIEALQAIAATGRKAVFYPFILMELVAGNGRPDPYGNPEQPVMPWRGRITTSKAPGRVGTTDGTAAARAEVDAFFGAARASDFSVVNGSIHYAGPAEWSYRRFILHYAHLCALAGGVDAFLIGSEMVAMTQIRGAGRSYPAVEQLRRLAADVRAILGPEVKLSYAADWSEYFGHHPGDGEAMFHLDPLWADPNIDFIGIDNYMPMSDWRDGSDHLDAYWKRIDNHAYLLSNVSGGEGYDWYYANDDDRDQQRRTPIRDGAYGEDWVWRYKDLKGWWQNPHFNRPGGVRSEEATEWVPGSKPFWFTEIGCAALDKGTNQPNKFLDAMSSESRLPHYSNARRDDGIQTAYIRAMAAYWSDPASNPAMADGRRMVDVSRAHVWCWDARPYPAFPQRLDLWSDGLAWERGHWLNGRAGTVPLASVVGDICRRAGILAFDTSGLSGTVRGYVLAGDETGRAALQPLMLAHGFDAVERDGALRFVMRNGLPVADLGPEHLALADDIAGFEASRAAEPELAGRIRLTHVEAGSDFAPCTAETMLPGDDPMAVSDSEFPMAFTRSEGRAIAERWLAESRIARDSARFALPPSLSHLGAGDVVRMQGSNGHKHLWRIDRVERAGALTVDAVRVEPGVYVPALATEISGSVKAYRPHLPVWPVFLDLPLMRGDEVPHAPYVAASGKPWPGRVATFLSPDETGGFELDVMMRRPAIMGLTESPLRAARPGMMDRGAPLRLRLNQGELRSIGQPALLNGGNLLAIGDGSSNRWELLQFVHAVPVEPGLWDISHRLRGQAGTDAVIPAVWPIGSAAVLVDRAVVQLDLPPSVRGQERFWRIGPAERPVDDRSYRSGAITIRSVGLRPYSPCHLRCEGRQVSWTRRTRIDGDGWDGPDVPLGENREQYLLRLRQAGSVIHEMRLDRPEYQVPQSVWLQALADGAFHIEVAQLSDQFGAGPFTRREINGGQ